MTELELKQLLESSLEGCDIDVSLEGNHLTVTAVGEVFAGLRPVKRQQMVYAPLNELIADGTIHAVNINASAPGE